MSLIDPKDPFYQPLWRRLAIVAVCAAWLGFELHEGAAQPLFAVIAGGILLYAAWVLVLNWQRAPPAD